MIFGQVVCCTNCGVVYFKREGKEFSKPCPFCKCEDFGVIRNTSPKPKECKSKLDIDISMEDMLRYLNNMWNKLEAKL